MFCYFIVNCSQLHQIQFLFRMLQTKNKSTSIVIDSLQPYSQYKAVVLANTKYGDGEQESAPLYIHTLEDGLYLCSWCRKLDIVFM